MKRPLDTMLVLTKQDLACHVIHTSSDPFYQTWLHQLNGMQYCKVRSAPPPYCTCLTRSTYTDPRSGTACEDAAVLL